MKNPLVSIITPCFNGEGYVSRYLDSVLAQIYDNIELIFVNDGSTDKTEKIVLSYKERFEQKNIKFIYIYQENKGQAAALNRGLKIFNGEYLIWPDADDILDKNNIKCKVDFLEKNNEFGMVICKTRMIDEVSLKQIGTLERKHKGKEDNLFYDLIMENNVYFAPGGYMGRTSAFLNVNCERNIYESRVGQNWQMLLPLAYKYKCGYLDEYLYYYFVRKNSHSRIEKTEKEISEKLNNQEKLLIEVILEMDIPDKEYYLELIKKKYISKRLELVYIFKNKKIAKEQYSLMRQNNYFSFHNCIMYFRTINRLIDISLKIVGLPFKIIRKLKRIIKND